MIVLNNTTKMNISNTKKERKTSCNWRVLNRQIFEIQYPNIYIAIDFVSEYIYEKK